MTYLTVPIAAKNHYELKEQIKAAKAADAEMLELRTDYLENLSVELANKVITEARGAALPIIVTCRDITEGGKNEYPQDLRVEILSAALEAGADFIDFEYENFLASTTAMEKLQQSLCKKPSSRLILSAHDFKTKFDDISELYHRIRSLYPAAIPKLVYTANHINDCFEAFDLLHETGGERIILCMGAAGLVSRIIAKRLGSLVTFAGIDEENRTAPGQLTIYKLKKLYRYDSINAATELYGLIGSPVAHSSGPAVHNACFADIGANKLYLPLLVDGSRAEFDKFMSNILAREWLGFAGFSVTIPHKANSLDFVKQNQGFVEPLTRKIGAANTLIIDESQVKRCEWRISAYNTDYTGAMGAIILVLGQDCLKGLAVVVIGAGGVARAIVAGLTDAGARVKIYNRTVEKAEKLASEFNCDFAPLAELSHIEAKLLINCTSIGMHPDIDATPLPKKYIKKDMVVFDTVYNPAETLLLKHARQVGAKTIDGLTMFINQADAQFKLFTGQATDSKLMRKTIANCLSSR